MVNLKTNQIRFLKTNLTRLRVFIELLLFPMIILELAVLSFWLKPRKDTWYFILNNHIGDSYVFCSLVHSFKKIHHGRVAVILPKRYAYIGKLFKDIDEVYAVNLFVPNYVGYFIYPIKGRIVPAVKSLPLLLPNIPTKYFNFTFEFKLNNGLPVNARFSKPYIETKYTKRARSLINKLSTTKKKVLLVPFVHGEKSPIDMRLWQNLINYLNNNGYEVFVNSRFHFYGAINIYLPIELAIPFVENMAIVISVRTGFVDLIISTKVKKIIIYKDKTQMYFWSIKAYNYVKPKNKIIEITQDEFNKIYEMIRVLN